MIVYKVELSEMRAKPKSTRWSDTYVKASSITEAMKKALEKEQKKWNIPLRVSAIEETDIDL